MWFWRRAMGDRGTCAAGLVADAAGERRVPRDAGFASGRVLIYPGSPRLGSADPGLNYAAPLELKKFAWRSRGRCSAAAIGDEKLVAGPWAILRSAIGIDESWWHRLFRNWFSRRIVIIASRSFLKCGYDRLPLSELSWCGVRSPIREKDECASSFAKNYGGVTGPRHATAPQMGGLFLGQIFGDHGGDFFGEVVVACG
ncbi:MAG: hypothetical protein JWR15_2971 [Prosthecobacter sp.]|nr:hypothetical protein [Prosthecobacter sp.]